MYTLTLLLSPIIMLLIAFVVYHYRDKSLKNGLHLIKISIKYALVSALIIFAYSYFALSVRDNISVADINYESITSLLFLCPVGFAFGQLIALIRWKYLKTK